MSHNADSKPDHRHAGPADEHGQRTGQDSLQGKREYGTGGDSAPGSGDEAARAKSHDLNPPGDPDEASRDEWEKIAKHQGLLTPDEEMPTPHLPKK